MRKISKSNSQGGNFTIVQGVITLRKPTNARHNFGGDNQIPLPRAKIMWKYVLHYPTFFTVHVQNNTQHDYVLFFCFCCEIVRVVLVSFSCFGFGVGEDGKLNFAPLSRKDEVLHNCALGSVCVSRSYFSSRKLERFSRMRLVSRRLHLCYLLFSQGGM